MGFLLWNGERPEYRKKVQANPDPCFQDDFPLASLPLLGYSVEKPSEGDQIQKDFVFKLVFKNHVYFFRAESQYTFVR